MPSVRARLLPGTPVWALAVVVLAAVGSLVTGAGRTAAATSVSPVRLLLVTTVHAGLLVVLVWRARAVPHERAVWLRIALGATVLTATVLLGNALALAPGMHGAAAALAAWAPVLAFPLLYGGLVRWNRYSTNLADPHDVLNGAGAVLAVVAVGNLVVQLTGGPLATAPWWTVQPLLGQFAAEFVLLGTVATLPFLGALGRDPRTWLVVTAFGVSLAGSTAALLGAGHGWAAAAEPIAVVCLAAAAVLRSARSDPQPADPAASTIGAFTVIVAATAVLVVTALVGAGAAAAWCAAFAALGSSLRLLVNVQELALLADTRREALTDELTGLANRRAVLRRAEELSAEGTPMALAVLDLDKFKEVNDALGHAAGDVLLRMVAERLASVLRPGDVLGRLGGDEFAVLAPLDAEAPVVQSALRVGARLHERLAEPFPIEGMVVHSAVSVGLTTSAGSAPTDPARLLREADVAMYDAKRSGTGVALYDSSRHADSSGHLALVEELRTALTTGQLVLHHQPQLDVATGRPVGVEALVRWAHPTRGLLGPAEFLPLAEVHGLMGALSDEVLAQAVAQAAAWRRGGLPLRMSVNLSASNLLDAALPGRVAGLLARHDVPPESLVLEVTESVLLTDPERSLAVVGALAGLGVTVSIDDFGTGYSSLAYLRDLPVAELKLDRSFTADLLTDPRTEAIVSSTVELAHRLGLHVVAEGVEDEATLRHLERLDCDTSQGFLHSRPVPAAELETWLSARPAAAARP
ncbi:putative bifunctional diguanylate cyclase/phosphodiesterase [Blastococcus xanthinilyticus]|uniref:Diguanylate cyclase (GGDEF)-like protein n=1 Tax=Blastococcus xanthinilyticus TaxID=1564164 RepID=A0A5S5CXK7_9ACTN|nr:EAL domain-containing protein [Blastococcus xanthinilyticus]TYP88507.1 diguanylate cyclase (GGDEF)-like protein [Blastococcus xanthinilyticus]